MAKEPDDRYGSAGALGRAASRSLTNSGYVAAPDADTLVAPMQQRTISTAPPPVFGNHISTGPQPEGVKRDTHRLLAPVAAIGVVGALLLGAIGVIIGMLASRAPTDASNQASPTAIPAPTVTVAGPTVVQTVPAPTSAKPVVPPSTPSARIDEEAASYQQLREIANRDRSFVSYNLTDMWVPQLSSKRPGVVDQGLRWDNSLTLQEHYQLRQRYNAKLLWAGDWSTFDAPNFWVTIVPVTFATPDGALSWCTAQGFDRDHCLAKLVSTTHPVKGSTKLN